MVADAHAGYTAGVTKHFVQHMIPFDGDVAAFSLFNQAIGKDFLGLTGSGTHSLRQIGHLLRISKEPGGNAR